MISKTRRMQPSRQNKAASVSNRAANAGRRRAYGPSLTLGALIDLKPGADFDPA